MSVPQPQKKMQTPLPIPLNPSLLTWARNESGYHIDRVAKRLGVKPDRVEEWESGERVPTLRQIQELAKFLHRPLNVFFLSTPPTIPALSTEYRRLPGITPGDESPELRLALRQMINRRESALDLMDELGDSVHDFSLLAHLHEDARIVGARLRTALSVSVATQLTWRDDYHAWREWRAAAESLNVLVFQYSGIALASARGVSLLKLPMPVVGINSKEQPDSCNFTLMHELVHIMLAAGHDELPASQETRSNSEWTKVERFAELAASHALVPEDTLREAISQHSGVWDIAIVRSLARRFRITPLAMATRLRSSDFMTWSEYNVWRDQWKTYTDALPEKKGGFVTPVLTALGRNGRYYTRLVIEALDSNRITSVDASRYLGLKFQHMDKLRITL